MTEPTITDETALIERMTRPSRLVEEAVAALEGDILILGVGGKMGPTDPVEFSVSLVSQTLR